MRVPDEPFLYYYRMVGVILFEITQVRAILFIFPNTFEYFFIFVEAVRLRLGHDAHGQVDGDPLRGPSGSSSSCRRSGGSTSPSST